MNVCLDTVRPFACLLLEARFGRSTLQNYSGLLRNEITGERLEFFWRGVLFLSLALPLVLSAAYKTFDGGSSSIHSNSLDLLDSQPCYGTFTPPGLQQIENVGLTLFSNATLPFVLATSPTVQDKSEPSLPADAQAYGFNMLMIDEDAVAFVDIPEPHYVSLVQEKLATGESWNISTTVYGTVATFDASYLPINNNASFMSSCNASVSSGPGNWEAISSFTGIAVHFFIPYTTNHNNALMYLGIVPTDANGPTSCGQLSEYVQPFRISRQICPVTWTFTRGGFQLKEGSCAPGAPKEVHAAFVDPYLLLPYWYMTPLFQLLGPFAAPRQGSPWFRVYMAASAAGTLWSRIVSLGGPAGMYNSSGSLLQYADELGDHLRNADNKPGLAGQTWQEIRFLYSAIDAISYARPTLRKSAWLYVILTIQPLLTISLVLLSILLYSTPIGHNFGVVSVLSGTDRSSLDSLRGAGLSGKMDKDIQMIITATHSEGSDEGILEYRLPTSSSHTRQSDRLIRRIAYS